MNESFAKRRPMIDLEEFDKDLRSPRPTPQKDSEPLAELLRIIGSKHRSGVELKAHRSVKMRQCAGVPSEWKLPDARGGIISGDFASIEAGLLGAKQQPAILRATKTPPVEQQTANERVRPLSGDFTSIEAGLLSASRKDAVAIVSEADVPNLFPNLDLGSERWLQQDKPPASDKAIVAEGPIRSRRPIYVILAIVVAGIVGMVVSFGFRSGDSNPSEFATIEDGSAQQQTEATNAVDVPTQDAATLSEPVGSSPTELANGTEQPLDLTQAEEKTPPAPVESQAAIDSESAAAQLAPAPALLPPGTLSMAPVEPEKMKTDLVQPNGVGLPASTPPQANIHEAPPAATHPAAQAKVPTAKPIAHAAKTPKPAAANQPGAHAQPRQIVNKAKAAPASAEPAPIAETKAEPPAAQPSPATNGAFGFVQGAVNSLTSTTAKLLQWGKN